MLIQSTSLAFIRPPVIGGLNAAPVHFGLKTLAKDLITVRNQWKQTEAEALALFKENPDNEQLKKATQALCGVEFFDGSDPNTPWVNDVCLEMGSNFLHVPPSLRYKISSPITQSNSEFDKVLARLDKEKKLGIFLTPKYGPQSWILKHEILHVLQHKNGLHSGSSDPEIDRIASNFIQAFHQFPSKNPVLQGIFRVFRIFDSYTVEVPLIFLKGLFTGRLFKAMPQETPGKAVRLYAEREMEVDKFFITHGRHIGVSFATRVEHISHFFCESMLQYLRSFKLDFSAKH